MKTPLILFGVIVVCSITFKTLICIANNLNEIRSLRLKNELLELENNILKDENRLLEQQRNHLIKNTRYDNEVINAIKKLVIYSHPDKGICSSSDDFIKYKKLYDRIKGAN